MVFTTIVIFHDVTDCLGQVKHDKRKACIFAFPIPGGDGDKFLQAALFRRVDDVPFLIDHAHHLTFGWFRVMGKDVAPDHFCSALFLIDLDRKIAHFKDSAILVADHDLGGVSGGPFADRCFYIQVRHPLTAPFARPRMRYRCASRAKIKTGINTNVPDAAMRPHNTDLLVINEVMIIGSVRAPRPVRITAYKNSFQQYRKARMAVAAIPGIASGRLTRTNAPKREQPSIMAASSSSTGTSSKKPIIIQVLSGIVKVR